jgi:hypothetical protein
LYFYTSTDAASLTEAGYIDENQNWFISNGTLDVNGNDIIIDADGDSIMHSPADDVIAFELASAEVARFTNDALAIGPTTVSDFTLVHANRDSAGAGWWGDTGTFQSASAEVLAIGIVNEGMQFGTAVQNVSDGGAVQYTNTDMDVSGTNQTTTIWTDASYTLYLELTTGGQVNVYQDGGDASERTFRVIVRYAYV